MVRSINKDIIKMKPLLSIFIVFILLLSIQNFGLITINIDNSSVSESLNKNKSKKNNQDIDDEIRKTKTYYVYWPVHKKSLSISKNQIFVSKDEQFVQTIKIPMDNIKNILFELIWEDDITSPFLNIGKDILKFTITSPDKKDIFKTKNIGNGKIKYVHDKINIKPNIESLEAVNESDAYQKLKKYYNSNWKDEPLKLKIDLKIGEIRFLRRLLDKGNYIDLIVSYEFYNPEITTQVDNPPDTIIQSSPNATTGCRDIKFTWIGSDDFTPVGDLNYSYKLLNFNSHWSDWTKDKLAIYIGLSEGDYNFLVRAKDHRDNIQIQPASHYFQIILNDEQDDFIPPNTIITAGPSGRINYSTITYEWKGTDETSFEDEIVFSYILEGKDTSWSNWTSLKTITYSNLSNQYYLFKVRAKDKAGNIDPSPDVRSITVDTTDLDFTPPETSIASGPSGIIKYNTVTFNWIGSDDITSSEDLQYSYIMEGYGDWSSFNSFTTATFYDLVDRTYVFKVRAKDEAGNIDPTPDSRTFIVDLAEPNRYATSVVELFFGENHDPGYEDPEKVLGGPHGLGDTMGSLDVLSLGKNGYIILGFDVVIKNGPGKDFIIFENPFYINDLDEKLFAELMYVEVSSDGTNFARFPSISNTPEPGLVDPDDVSNLAGVIPVYANVEENEIDPFNPNVAGGDAFDLDDLENDPLVQSGTVDLQNINYIKIIDILGDGSNLDSLGNPIFDPIGIDNGADLDAISIINYN